MQNAPGVTKRAKISALVAPDIDPVCVCARARARVYVYETVLVCEIIYIP